MKSGQYHIKDFCSRSCTSVESVGCGMIPFFQQDVLLLDISFLTYCPHSARIATMCLTVLCSCLADPKWLDYLSLQKNSVILGCESTMYYHGSSAVYPVLSHCCPLSWS